MSAGPLIPPRPAARAGSVRTTLAGPAQPPAGGEAPSPPAVSGRGVLEIANRASTPLLIRLRGPITAEGGGVEERLVNVAAGARAPLTLPPGSYSLTATAGQMSAGPHTLGIAVGDTERISAQVIGAEEQQSLRLVEGDRP